MASLYPNGRQQYFNNEGVPLAGGKVYTYVAGTLTKKKTWQDHEETIENTNPVILNARGEALIYMRGSYKMELRDAEDNQIWVTQEIGNGDIDDERDLAIAAVEAEKDASLVEMQLVVDQAEVARDAATVNAGVYVSVAAGLAAVADGVQFQVVSGDGMEINRYRRDAGPVAVLVATYPSALAITSKFESIYSTNPNYLWAVLDSAQRILLSVNPAGELQAKMPGHVPYTLDSLEEDLYVITDTNNRQLFRIRKDGTLVAKIESNEEILDARGSRASVNDRISQSLSPYGLPNKHIWGEWYLRETRQRLRKLALSEVAQLVVASIGDSWTHNADRWCRPVARSLIAQYGDAGSGWVGFGNLTGVFLNGNIDTAKVTTVFSGVWDNSVYYTSVSPDLGEASTATAGAKITVTGQAGTSAIRLFYIGAAGVIRYRFDAGAWTNIDTTGSGLLDSLLVGVPVTAFTLEIENVSGVTTLCGLDIQKTTNGVRWHKLGATGSNSAHWGAVDAAQWQAGIADLSPNLVVIMHGTNDQSGAPLPSVFATRIEAIIDRVRAAVPTSDILIVMPCENGRVNAVPMSDYAAAAYEVAAANRCAFMDLQYLFGESFSEYASGSGRPWFNADLIHPEPSTGGRAIVDGVVRLLTNI